MNEQRTLLSETSGNSSQEHEEVWRNEVHAKLARYRSRRGRRIEGAFTMRFPFTQSEESAAAAAKRPAMAVPPGSVGEPVPDKGLEPATIQTDERIALIEPPPATDTVSEANAVVEQHQPEVAEAAAESFSSSEISDVSRDATRDTSESYELSPGPVGRPPARRKVIAFPRAATVTDPPPPRLADPVLPEQPRILDVPEELEAYTGTPLLDGLQFGPAPQQSPAPPADHIELPFRTATLPRRVYAGIVDCLLVGAAAGLFGAAGYKLLPKVEISKPLMLTAASVPVLLWSVYQYIFLIYGGATPGMRAARIRLRTFKGHNPKLRHRRSRLIALYFSTASLAMGLLWGMVDIDCLCWHDRISRTFLTEAE